MNKSEVFLVVETKSSGQDALSELRKRQEHGIQFDLVLSDVYMPDMDGFKLLENIGLELEIPVIMMSSDGDTSVVLRGVTHGAVDFLIKPVRIEELKNVWQHVVRRRSSQLSRGTTAEESGAEQDGDSRVQGTKRKEGGVIRAEHEGGSGGKKPRVVWSVEMHQQFVYAVNTLGIDKAVPKRILDLMNVEGLTRENVASHLQKYRLYLKRVEGVAGKGEGGRASSANKGNKGSSFVKSSHHEMMSKHENQSNSMGQGVSREVSKSEDQYRKGIAASGSTQNLQGVVSSSVPWHGMAQPYGASQRHMYGAAMNPTALPGSSMAAWGQQQQNLGIQSGMPSNGPPVSGYSPAMSSGFYNGMMIVRF